MSEIFYKAHYQNDIIAFCLNILGIAIFSSYDFVKIVNSD